MSRLLIILLLTGCAGTLANKQPTKEQVTHCVTICAESDAIVSGMEVTPESISCHCVDEHYGN